MKMENNVENSTNSAPEVNTPPSQPELTINDLNNVRSVIDLAVRRGAFSGSEASSVGAVFDKLNAFLNAIAAANQQPAQEQQPQQ